MIIHRILSFLGIGEDIKSRQRIPGKSFACKGLRELPRARRNKVFFRETSDGAPVCVCVCVCVC